MRTYICSSSGSGGSSWRGSHHHRRGQFIVIQRGRRQIGGNGQIARQGTRVSRLGYHVLDVLELRGAHHGSHVLHGLFATLTFFIATALFFFPLSLLIACQLLLFFAPLVSFSFLCLTLQAIGLFFLPPGAFLFVLQFPDLLQTPLSLRFLLGKTLLLLHCNQRSHT